MGKRRELLGQAKKDRVEDATHKQNEKKNAGRSYGYEDLIDNSSKGKDYAPHLAPPYG